MEYLLVLPIEAMPVGTVYEKGGLLPLHCTVMHWFTTPPDRKLSWLRQQVMLLACSVHEEHIELISKAPAMFGPENDLPCYTLARNPDLERLHNDVFAMPVTSDSLPKERRWIGAGYRPHVTSTTESIFVAGTHFNARLLVLVGRDKEKVKTVLHAERLGQIPF